MSFSGLLSSREKSILRGPRHVSLKYDAMEVENLVQVCSPSHNGKVRDSFLLATERHWPLLHIRSYATRARAQ